MTSSLQYLTPEQVNQVRKSQLHNIRPYSLQSSSSARMGGARQLDSIVPFVLNQSTIRYLKIPAFLTPDEVEAMLTRTRQLLENFSLEDHPLVGYTFRYNAYIPLMRANRLNSPRGMITTLETSISCRLEIKFDFSLRRMLSGRTASSTGKSLGLSTRSAMVSMVVWY